MTNEARAVTIVTDRHSRPETHQTFWRLATERYSPERRGNETIYELLLPTLSTNPNPHDELDPRDL